MRSFRVSHDLILWQISSDGPQSRSIRLWSKTSRILMMIVCLLSIVQRHTPCSSNYCLRKKQNDSELTCGFNFPFEFCTKGTSHLQRPKKSSWRRNERMSKWHCQRTLYLKWYMKCFMMIIAHLISNPQFIIWNISYTVVIRL